MKINKLYVEREETREQLREEAANTPFPSTNGIQLIHGDFNDKLKGIPDNSIDPMRYFNIIVAEPEEVAIDVLLVEKGFYADYVTMQSSRGGTDWWNLCQ